MKIDYQNDDYDFIAAYGALGEVQPLLEQALTVNLFGAIGENLPPAEIKALISADEGEADCFLEVLRCAGLLILGDGFIANAPVAAKYLVLSSPHYCGALPAVNTDFLWSRLALLLGDVGEHAIVTEDFPFAVPAGDGSGALILAGHLDEALLAVCAEDGVIAVVGRYREDYGLSAAVALYRAYRQGAAAAVIDGAALAAFCKVHQLCATPRITLNEDFSVVFVSRNDTALAQLALTKEDRLIAALKEWNIRSLKLINPAAVVTADWVKDHCRFGCSGYGEKCCPPHSPGYAETETRLAGYGKALLIEGQPPTGDFQRLMLNAERMAFKAGYYKAFAYWAGPCSLCTECKKPALPKKCTATRPSMESAGIDVFATVRDQGHVLRTLKDKSEFVKYFGLLLLE